MLLNRFPNAERYNNHSFQIGTASTAAVNNTPFTDIQRAGRWISSAFASYVRQPITLEKLPPLLLAASLEPPRYSFLRFFELYRIVRRLVAVLRCATALMPKALACHKKSEKSQSCRQERIESTKITPVISVNSQRQVNALTSLAFLRSDSLL